MTALPDHRPLARDLTRLVGALAALVLLAVSAAMNYLFLSSLGKTPVEGHVLGAASAAADLLKAVLPFLILWAWRAGRISVALPGLLVWAVFTVFSLLSAIGFAAGNRESITDARAGTVQRYETLRSDLKAAQEERERLPGHRAADIVAAAIEAHKQHRRWASTKGCRNATVPDSRTYCRDYYALRAEAAAAQRNAVLSKKIEDLRAQVHVLREAGGAREPEPQVGLLARLFGLSRDPVRLVLILLIAGLVELGAGLGLYLSLSGWGRVSGGVPIPARESLSDTSPAGRLTDGRRPVGTAQDFALACLEPAAGQRITETDLLEAYQRWCARENRRAMDQRAFAEAFRGLAKEIGIQSGPKGYAGVALSQAPLTANRAS